MNCVLADVATINMGQSPRGEFTNTAGVGLPLVGGAADLGEVTPVATRYTSTPTKICKEGDIILCVRATIGKLNVADRAYCLGRGVAGIRPSNIERDWLAYLLRNDSDRIDAAGIGTTFRQVDKQTLTTWCISLPPLAEQRRIVATIEALVARSRRTKNALASIPRLIDRYRQAILGAAFRGDLTVDWRAQNPDVEPASTLLERIRIERRRRWEEAELAKRRAKGKESTEDRWKARYREPTLEGQGSAGEEAGALEWAQVPLEMLCDAVRGIPYGIVLTGNDVPDGIPTVRGGDIKSFCIERLELKKVLPSVSNEYKRTLLRGGEVLIAIRGTVGQTAVAGSDMAGFNISREVAMIPPLDGVIPQYLMYILATRPAVAFLAQHTKGNAQRGINLADLRRLPVSLPPTAEQEEIVRALDAAFARLATVSELAYVQLGHLQRLDQSILAKAFRGELVPQDPADEPASLLLERIRTERTATPEQKRRIRRSGATTMPSRGKRRPIVEVLAERTAPLTPEQLFQMAGFVSEQVDDFYAEIKAAVEAGQIIQDSHKRLAMAR
jgi:type I restriction enzyme S subunit